jgi:hypothetical protein
VTFRLRLFPAAQLEQDVGRVAAQERAVGEAQAAATRLCDALLHDRQRLFAARVEVEQVRPICVAAHHLAEPPDLARRRHRLLEEHQAAVDVAHPAAVDGERVVGVGESGKSSAACLPCCRPRLLGEVGALCETPVDHEVLSE